MGKLQDEIVQDPSALKVHFSELRAKSQMSEGERSEYNAFYQNFEKISGCDPLAVLPPTSLNDALMSEFNPFWVQGRAVAIWIEDEIGLIAFSHPQQRLNETPAVYFGYFACRENAKLAPCIFARLKVWTHEQNAEVVIGPIQFKTAYDYRLRIDSFDAKTFWGEPQNPPHYVHCLQQNGFTVAQEYFSDFILDLDRVRKIARRKLPRATAAIALRSMGRTNERPRFEIFNLNLFAKNREEIFNLANDLFEKNVAFQPLNQFDFNVLYTEPLLKSLCQKTSFLIFDSENKLRGLCLSFAHPLDPDCLLIKTIGIEPTFRKNGRTFVEALQFIFDQSGDYHRLAFCLMTKGNQVHRLTEKYADQKRRYALFSKIEKPE